MERQDYSLILKNNRLKVTKSRIAVLEALEQSKQPLSVDQIYAKLVKDNLNIDISTIYRTLETFENKNIVVKLNITDENKSVFEFNNMLHCHYIICIKCKKIIPLEKCILKAYEKAIEKETNFTVNSHKLFIYGYCPECGSEER